MRGRRPKPAEIALKRGNPGHRAHKPLAQAAAPDPEAKTGDILDAATSDTPTPDARLDAREREIWIDYCIVLNLRGILKTSDHRALTRLCVYVHEWEELTASMRDARVKGGLRLIEKTKRKKYGTVIKPRTEFQMRQALESEICKLEDRFGLNPAARGAVMSRLASIRDNDRPLDRAGKSSPAVSNRKGATIAPASTPPASPIGLLMSTSNSKPN